MDNAAKAVIIAGGILIATMVVSVAMYIMMYAKDFAKASDSQARIVAIQSFNSFYDSFDEIITGLDLLNIYNKVQEDLFNKHEMDIQGIGVNLSEIVTALQAPTGGELIGVNFKYEITGYDSEGYVNQITIRNI